MRPGMQCLLEILRAETLDRAIDEAERDAALALAEEEHVLPWVARCLRARQTSTSSAHLRPPRPDRARCGHRGVLLVFGAERRAACVRRARPSGGSAQRSTPRRATLRQCRATCQPRSRPARRQSRSASRRSHPRREWIHPGRHPTITTAPGDGRPRRSSCTTMSKTRCAFDFHYRERLASSTASQLPGRALLATCSRGRAAFPLPPRRAPSFRAPQPHPRPPARVRKAPAIACRWRPAGGRRPRSSPHRLAWRWRAASTRALTVAPGVLRDSKGRTASRRPRRPPLAATADGAQ